MQLEVGLRAAQMNEAANISRTNFKYMYWSSVQQLVHHASSGCAMNVGDLLGSGTISGPEKDQRGSLLEISWNGTEPVELPGGVKRTFLEDGDSLVMRGWCQGDGYRVGFGEVEGTIVAGGLTPSVIARSEATKQSIAPHARKDGLLRFARNDAGRFTAPAAEYPASRAQCAATSSTLYFRCTRLSEGNCLVTQTPGRRSMAGRIGRRSKPPPQFGQTLCSLLSTQSAQNVHS